MAMDLIVFATRSALESEKKMDRDSLPVSLSLSMVQPVGESNRFLFSALYVIVCTHTNLFFFVLLPVLVCLYSLYFLFLNAISVIFPEYAILF